jgi:hypothetical protein
MQITLNGGNVTALLDGDVKEYQHFCDRDKICFRVHMTDGNQLDIDLIPIEVAQLGQEMALAVEEWKERLAVPRERVV